MIHDVAASNLKLLCGGGRKFVGWNYNLDNYVDSTWSKELRCRKGQFLCGIRTRVQDPQGAGIDDTSLNQVSVKCCKRKVSGESPSEDDEDEPGDEQPEEEEDSSWESDAPPGSEMGEKCSPPKKGDPPQVCQHSEDDQNQNSSKSGT